ncbi:peptidyl-prolyl cis-trans isomerase domain-containing protein [Clostridium sartagoforme AAU1]|uniref:Peptidyl-prolyl cis-trans isomerase domain-containing protein n=1 Tax=Clostridium sartagoforme AAU1 TaxID=1202534 RepID=R9C7A4_9CLOT|nr:peptidylprolyl isomerase [Clostridium sartagoforme]EOR25168.1 peptidyl-prolyl cis-trans isomerase domain-containing protein [Clostridium sartagoforme AAU1]
MEDKILATVAGREIKESDLQTVVERYPAERRGYFETVEAKKQLLEQMVSFELINILGKELNIDSTEEYKENVRQAEKDILTQLTINKVLLEVTVTDEDALNYYNTNKDAFIQQPTISAKHILVDSKELCDKIKNEITLNEITFEDAAIKYSTCPSKEQGGNLGSFGRGMMVPEFEDAAFNLEINVVSDPVQTQFGYHLIKVEDKNEGKEMLFEEVKEQIVNTLLQDMQQRKYLDVVKELEKKYGVTRA